MFAKFISILMSILVSLSSFYYSLTVKPYEKDTETAESYPFVFVHGFFGYGYESGLSDVVEYWGGGTLNLITELNKLGYTCVTAGVGPISSNWDRACELYAQLTGTTVDYGEAHSKAHNHARYGKTYTEPIVEGFGEKDENGNINKINLVGHSFGGNTSRLLEALLTYGDAAEIAATTDGTLSPLFAGGNDGLINSITTVATPHNGTTLMYIGEETGLLKLFEDFSYNLGAFVSVSGAEQIIDFKLDQFGIKREEDETLQQYIEKVSEFVDKCSKDSAFYDMSPEGAEELNERCKANSNVYYYSVPMCTTEETAFGTQIADANTMVLLRPFCAMIGSYSENTVSDYKIDESWLPNDGMVNTISETAPFDEPSVDYNFGETAEKGVWNVLPVRQGDHSYAIGGLNSQEELLDYYTALLDTVNTNK